MYGQCLSCAACQRDWQPFPQELGQRGLFILVKDTSLGFVRRIYHFFPFSFLMFYIMYASLFLRVRSGQLLLVATGTMYASTTCVMAFALRLRSLVVIGLGVKGKVMGACDF